MAQLQLWLPVLIISHVFALFWLLKVVISSQLVALRRCNCKDGGAAASAGVDSSPLSAGASKGHLHAGARGGDVVLIHVTAQGSKSAQKHSQTANCVAHLAWQSISCSYDVRGTTKAVLHDISGESYAGQMQALMGPSGAGKSTLMDILAMRKSVGKVTGQLLVNGQPADKAYLKSTSYVSQEDIFIPTMTCEETLAFYAALILPDCAVERKVHVQEVLREMGLTSASTTAVGGTLPGGLAVRGLSGGEKRRLSIAVGVLGSPTVLFLDEPTSGLDSFAALNVVGYLKQMAQDEQQVVICTIHQPRSAIWSMFDTVTLLASGHLMYHGPCSGMTPWFESLGYQLFNGSESDWVLDLVAIGFDKPLSALSSTMKTLEDVQAASQAFQGAQPKALQIMDAMPSAPSSGGQPSAAVNEYTTGWFRQFRALAGRELASSTRNPFNVAGSMSASPLDTMRHRLNLLYGMLLACTMLPFTSLSNWTDDKRIHTADMAAKRYRLRAYYVAKLLAQIPFNVVVSLTFAWIAHGMAGLRPGAEHVAKFGVMIMFSYFISTQVLHLCVTYTSDQDSAFCGAVLFIAIQVIFSSFFITFRQVTLYGITMLRYLSAQYFTLEAVVRNEFDGTALDCAAGMDSSTSSLIEGLLPHASSMQRTILRQMERPQPGCVVNPEAMVRYLDYYRDFGTSVGILVGYLGVLHILTYIGLAVLARRDVR